MTRLPHLVFAAAIALLVGGCVFIISVLGRPPSPLESKLADAERNLYYRLDDRGGVALGLSGREDQVKLVAHAVMAPPYREDRRVEFGVGVELWSPAGEQLLDAELFTSSRQSKADLVDGLYLHENAFSLESSIELSDDRVLLVTLPLAYPLGSELRLRKLGDPSEVIVRAYARRRRSTSARERALQTLESGERDKLIARSTYLPWVFIPVHERRRRVAYRFERLAAVGEINDDFRTVAIWYTGYRKPRRRFDRPVSTPATVAVSRTASVAVPVGTVSAVTIANGSADAASLSLTQITATEAVTTDTQLAAGADTTVAIAQNAATLVISCDTAEPRSLSLAATARATGESRPLSPRWVSTRWTPIAPDRPAVISLVPSTDRNNRLVRLSARAVGPAAATLTSAQLVDHAKQVTLVYVTNSGAELGRQTMPLTGERSRFDSIAQPDGKVSSVSESSVAQFLVPIGTERVRVSTSSGSAVIRPALFAPAPDGAQTTTDTRDGLPTIPADHRWRFSRPPSTLWSDVIPDGAPQVVLRGQRRPERR